MHKFDTRICGSLLSLRFNKFAGDGKKKQEPKEKATVRELKDGTTFNRVKINIRIILEGEDSSIRILLFVQHTYVLIRSLNIACEIFREKVASRCRLEGSFDSTILPIIRAVICIKRNEN